MTVKNFKQKIRTYKIPIPFYRDDPLNVYVCQCANAKEALKLVDIDLDETIAETMSEKVQGFFVCDESENYHLLFCTQIKVVNVQMIVHEVVHFARTLLAVELGVDLTTETNEVYAYFIGYFVQKIYNALHKSGVKFL